jgi:acetyl-CoA carboxylase biotin carboxyl carrier protein
MPNVSPADQVRQFSALLAGTDIAQLELRTAQGVLVVRRDGGAVATPPEMPAATHAVVAPNLGIFLHQHPLHDAPLARAGQSVRAGEIVGFLRIGALLLGVSAAHDGVIAEVTAAHGAIVGYGAPVMLMTRG